MKRNDIVIEGIWAVRKKIAEEFNNNTHAFIEHYKKLEKKYKDRIITSSIPDIKSTKFSTLS